MKTQLSVPVKLLKHAPHNPPGRTQPEKVKDLALSMEAIGLIYPVAITKDNEIIDGHRRLEAAKSLGWKEVDCVIVEGDSVSIYANINSVARKMGGNDLLGVYLKNPLAVAPRHRERIAEMEKCIGTDLVRRIFNHGSSVRMYKAARQVANYCECQTDDFVKAVVEWLLKFPVVSDVTKAMALSEPPKVIVKAIRSMKPIKFKATVAA